MTFAIATILKPFVALLLLLAIRPMVDYVRRTLPDGRLKRILFFSWE